MHAHDLTPGGHKEKKIEQRSTKVNNATKMEGEGRLDDCLVTLFLASLKSQEREIVKFSLLDPLGPQKRLETGFTGVSVSKS